MEPDTITFLYDEYVAGRMPTDDKRWETVNRVLEAIAKKVVEGTIKSQSRQGVPFGSFLRDRVFDVHTALLTKFIEKRLARHSTSLMPLINRVAVNETMSACRRDRSPAATDFDTLAVTIGIASEPGMEDDLFAKVRGRMGRFRFPEYELVREAVLAARLMRGAWPSESILGNMGVTGIDRAVMMTAIKVDINRAMLELVHDS